MMKKAEYIMPEIESAEIIGTETLCQSPASFGGSTSNYGQDDEDIF